ncbi:methyltransferase [Kitasatospora sp. MBT66]|uniref:methyltransferase n=1 Tax=Kitasatospora sp. MBT66 TaxID=1444769 RepID=UPI00068D9DFF|nr:methyltransferase [Kitasatospora sp. MBT66]
MMAKLTRQQATLHAEACELLTLDRDLTPDERLFVLDNWQESATSRNTLDGAFFTPPGLAVDMAVEVTGHRIVDLCAGIGALASACLTYGPRGREIVCVERNPLYVEVGRRVVPDATWIQADIFDLPDGLGRFDTAVSNPPYGATPRTGDSPAYRGRRFEYHVIAIASRLAAHGVFLVPQESAPFRASRSGGLTTIDDPEYERFTAATGIRLDTNCGLDTSSYRHEWRGAAPRTEIVLTTFGIPRGPSPTAAETAPGELALFPPGDAR